MRVFDTTFDYKTDTPSRTKPDPDKDSHKLRADHKLLWSKKLPLSEKIFALKVTTRKDRYLIFTVAEDEKHCYGSDAVTSSYTTWVTATNPKSKALVDAITGLSEEQKLHYLSPLYTIGSAMIWPIRNKDYGTMNRARGVRLLIADRIDLTLECIRRHYAEEPGSPLADSTTAYADFFVIQIDRNLTLVRTGLTTAPHAEAGGAVLFSGRESPYRASQQLSLCRPFPPDTA